MEIKEELVKIEKNAFDCYNFESSLYNKKNLSECELMILLGAIFGDFIINPEISDGCSISIDIIWNNPE